MAKRREFEVDRCPRKTEGEWAVLKQ